MSGRGVLVTGASRGIGAACARAFAEAGDRVAIHYSSSEQQAVEVLESLPGQGHVLVRGDLADAGQVRSFVDDAVAGLGGLDVLVNNAAVYVEHRIAEVTYEQWQDAWRQTVDVDLVGTANVTFCAARHMIAAGTPGRVVNVSSRGAFRGEPRYPAYGASKAGLNALGQSLARALAPHGIAVSSVAPGYVATDMAAQVLDGPDGERIRAESPFGRVARPEEVAAAVLYLASPEAEWASGTVLDLNGASHLRT
ncbi:MAG TPA: SDR family oxidoreductase [Motilibacteraceae bacterium]|nr:SDR family oxidoreductase [Motilibacteraceae bacterium]